MDFDYRLFNPSCATQKVYDEGARDVGLSALTGINATIFAYGQTSSGKTFTMRGITENVAKDIFEHIRSTPEREFVLKFSALEIYNEAVIDVLNRDSGPLRLLDDPEKGIIVDKQVEEVAKDSQHLKSLIGICEAQRQVGETALNDTSSRSHQIIKLTVKSSPREHSGAVKSYIASLNLVDLAGSERASQTNVEGMRLKEGSHINRSLLTLMTVITDKETQVLELEENDSSACETELQELKVRNLLTLKERVAKLQYQKQLLVSQVLELEENDSSACEIDLQEQSPLSWHLPFEEQKKQIIMLWHLCHVPIIHRSQFYLLFQGDLDDQMYMQVELRRLLWLEQQLDEVGNASPALLGDEPASSVTSSIMALKQEREQLSQRVTSRLTPQELEMLYIKWDVPPGGKQRRLQLVNKLWTDPHNMDHIQDSAEVVAKLVGFCESKEEMFQHSIISLSDKKSWMGWNLISNLLHF